MKPAHFSFAAFEISNVSAETTDGGKSGVGSFTTRTVFSE